MIVTIAWGRLRSSALRKTRQWPIYSRAFSTQAVRRTAVQLEDISPARTRNVGIIAHIDAGKTTTTERMLYYCGHTKRIGNVDDGSTVTDFLPAERARGITIQSAAITFQWSSGAWIPGAGLTEPCNINLVDTPGHADFTFEVLRSLRVLDGAVCILDGVAGVEAQTEKVWSQARKYGIPTICYVNKMDRDGARFGKSVREIATKLRIMPAVCQIPWYQDATDKFQGVIDVVNLRGMKWESKSDGKDVQIVALDEIKAENPSLAMEAEKARIHLIELLSEEDEIMVEKFLDYGEDHLSVPPQAVWASLRRCLLVHTPRISPVFAGSSFRNIGVQPVLDAITTLLPSPEEVRATSIIAGDYQGSFQDFVAGRSTSSVSTQAAKQKGTSKANSMETAKFKNLEACALAFKVVNDSKRGILVYVRVYHGVLSRNTRIYNTNLRTSERVPRLLRMYASDATDETSVRAGEICVIPGLKYARTGDTLITYTGLNPKHDPPAPINSLQLRPINVPPPVFFAAVEPFSSADQASVNTCLDLLIREDPSLQISENEETGQQLLNGMGELHLEIAATRLIQDFKAKASMGKIEIAYRERPSGTSPPQEVIHDRTLAGTQVKAGCTAIVSVLTPEELQQLPPNDSNLILVNGQHRSERLERGDEVSERRRSLHNGALSALARGPSFGFPVYGAKVEIEYVHEKHGFGISTTASALSGAARKATRAALEESAKLTPAVLLEPVMRVIVSVDDSTIGTVKRDIESSRDGSIESLEHAASVMTNSNSTTAEEDVRQVDLQKVYAPPDPYEMVADNLSLQYLQQQANNRSRTIVARVPLKEMIGYLKHLRSLTAGRGTFVMEVDGFKRMNTHREKSVLRELRGVALDL